jgi:hypothetical protein
VCTLRFWGATKQKIGLTAYRFERDGLSERWKPRRLTLGGRPHHAPPSRMKSVLVVRFQFSTPDARLSGENSRNGNLCTLVLEETAQESKCKLLNSK